MSDPRKVVENTLVPHSAFNTAMCRVHQCFEYADNSGEPIGLALIGESRTGKSRVLEEFYVQHRRSRTEAGAIIPIIRVKTPSKPTVKSFIELMLHNMGDPRFHSGTENRKIYRLLELMAGASTKMIMVDEFQHFFDKGSRKVMHHVADCLKNVVDEAKTALVVSGIETCRAVLDQNEQLAGRFLAPAIMPRLIWADDDHREEFVAILAAFHETMSVHFDLPRLDSDEMAFRFYSGTGGLIGYLAKTLRQVVWDALDRGRRVITFEDIAQAHRLAVWNREAFGGYEPFSRKTPTLPTPNLLASVCAIGTPKEIPTEPRKRARPAKSKCPTLNQVFTAT